MPEPLIVNAPYPTTEGLCPDAYSLRIISPAYASSASELNAILQYFYHYFNFNCKGFSDYAETVERIAIAEMIHLRLLGETIIALGADPKYCQNPATSFNFYSAKFVAYSDRPIHMVEDDIFGERQAISSYCKMLVQLKNEQVKKIIARILEDEKLHLETLNKILKELKNNLSS
jgi:bacterioferritin